MDTPGSEMALVMTAFVVVTDAGWVASAVGDPWFVLDLLSETVTFGALIVFGALGDVIICG